MFVLSVKTSRKQLLSLLGCLLILIAILLIVVTWPSGENVRQTSNLQASDDLARTKYLQSLGYETGAIHTEVREVLIPDEFDAVFAQYNEIQQTAGMDFTPYHGKRVKMWTYQIFNHPEGGDVYAHLYVYNDAIIGGDISSAAMDGFMTGLVGL